MRSIKNILITSIKNSAKYEFAMYNKITYFIDKLINPLIKILFFSFILIYCYGKQGSQTYIIGNIIYGFTFITLGGASIEFVRDRALGTLQYIEMSSTSTLLVFSFKIFYHVMISIFQFLVLFPIVSSIFKINITLVIFMKILIAVILIALSTSAFGMIIGVIGMCLKDINLILNLIQYAFMILTGINFSIDKLPNILELFSSFLPITHGLKAINHILEGDQYVFELGLEALIGIVFIIILLFIFNIVRKLAIKYNRLDLY